MGFTIEFNGSIYIGCFDEIVTKQFKFIATNLNAYFIEDLTFQELIGLFVYVFK